MVGTCTECGRFMQASSNAAPDISPHVLIAALLQEPSVSKSGPAVQMQARDHRDEPGGGEHGFKH